MHHRTLQIRRPCLCHMYSKQSNPTKTEEKDGRLQAPAAVTSMPHFLRRQVAVTRPARRAVRVSRGGGGQRPLALAIRPAEREASRQYHEHSSYAEEKRHHSHPNPAVVSGGGKHARVSRVPSNRITAGVVRLNLLHQDARQLVPDEDVSV